MQTGNEQPQLPFDFNFFVMKWSTSRRRFADQLEKLQNLVSDALDMVIITNIPRHHAKKLSQQSWTKNYHISKETRKTTEEHAAIAPPSSTTPSHIAPPNITVVYCRYPLYSEQWFPLTESEGFAHVAEVCIPLNAWHPIRSPVGLLQEYQLTYDEVSVLTFVIAPSAKDVESLKQTFTPQKVRNTVIFVVNGATESDNKIECGTSRLTVEPQFYLWKKGPILQSKPHIITLESSLGYVDKECDGGCHGIESDDSY